MSATKALTKGYENIRLPTRAKAKPIQTQFQTRRSFCLPFRFGLTVVIHVKLVWMWSQSHLMKLLFAFPFDPCLDEVFGKHAAGEKEFMVGLECIDRFFERGRCMPVGSQLGFRHLIDIALKGGSPGSILLLMPSMAAISIAVHAR